MLSKAKVQGAEPLALLMIGSMERGNAHAHTHTHIHTHAHTYTHTHTQTHTRTHTHLDTHTHAHTLGHTRTHTLRTHIRILRSTHNVVFMYGIQIILEHTCKRPKARSACMDTFHTTPHHTLPHHFSHCKWQATKCSATKAGKHSSSTPSCSLRSSQTLFPWPVYTPTGPSQDCKTAPLAEADPCAP